MAVHLIEWPAINEKKWQRFCGAVAIYRANGSDGHLQDLLENLVLGKGADHSIEWYDVEGSWTADRKLAYFMAPYVGQGVFTFVSDDGEMWGYRFSKGKVYTQVPHWKDGFELTHEYMSREEYETK